MLDKDSRKIGVKIDGVLVHKTDLDENIFKGSIEVKMCKDALEAAEAAHKKAKEDNILVAFRKAVHEFEEIVGRSPTTALLSYWDREYLVLSYGKWYREEHGASPKTFPSVVDGIRLKQGCTQTEGEITLQLFEDTEP